MSRFFPDVKINFYELEGETIKSIEAIKAEFGRTKFCDKGEINKWKVMRGI